MRKGCVQPGIAADALRAQLNPALEGMRSIHSQFSTILLCAASIVLAGSCVVHSATEASESNVPVVAPLATDSAGRSGAVAATSVVRVQCISSRRAGTGFLHRSGKVITAAHVVQGCADLRIKAGSRAAVEARVDVSSDRLDLALLSTFTPIHVSALPLAETAELNVGAQVATWGFPGGYGGAVPLLSVGYLAGIDARSDDDGSVVKQWVVNAAFNRGNSGGPLLLVETGEVIGVVSSKLAPMSDVSLGALAALEKQKNGFMYEAERTDGSTIDLSQGQIVALVLQELRGQIQLVIGQAATLGDIRQFLSVAGVEP